MNENTPEAFINALLVKHNVPLEAVIACAKEYGGALERMESIFDLKASNDARLLLTLPLLLVPTDADSIIKYFRNEERENQELVDTESDLNGSKTLLLSAFIYNPPFFAMAWNWCAYIRDRVRKQLERPFTVVKNMDSSHSFEFKPARRIMYRAAASGVPGFRQFGESTDFEGLGTLGQLVAEMGNRSYFQFSLDLSAIQIPRPFVMIVEFTTLKDGKSHQITLEDGSEEQEEPADIIYSKPVEGIDYSHGIEIHHAEWHPVKNNR
jgi:hypothetical protein